MKFPKKTKIFSQHYKTKFPHKFTEREDLGQADTQLKVIRITDRDSCGNIIPEQAIDLCYWHEVVEAINAINHEYLDGSLGHDKIRILGGAIHQILRDNFTIKRK